MDGSFAAELKANMRYVKTSLRAGIFLNELALFKLEFVAS